MAKRTIETQGGDVIEIDTTEMFKDRFAGGDVFSFSDRIYNVLGVGRELTSVRVEERRVLWVQERGRAWPTFFSRLNDGIMRIGQLTRKKTEEKRLSMWGFQIGDVVAGDPDSSNSALFDGEKGVVQDIESPGLSVEVTKKVGVCVTCRYVGIASPDGLILLERPSRTFKVGDRVRHSVAGEGNVIVLDPTDVMDPYLVDFGRQSDTVGVPRRSEPWFPAKYKTSNQNMRWVSASALSTIDPELTEEKCQLWKQAEELIEKAKQLSGRCQELLAWMDDFLAKGGKIKAELALAEKVQIMLRKIEHVGIAERMDGEIQPLPRFKPKDWRTGAIGEYEITEQSSKDLQEALHSVGVWVYHQRTGESEWSRMPKYYGKGYPALPKKDPFALIIKLLTVEEHGANLKGVILAFSKIQRQLFAQRKDLEPERVAKQDELERIKKDLEQNALQQREVEEKLKALSS